GLRSLPPLAGGSGPRGTARTERLPFLHRLAPHPSERDPEWAERRGPRFLLAPRRRHARARPRTLGDALSLGLAAAAPGTRRLEQPCHGRRLRRLRRRGEPAARRSRASLDHPQRALVHRIPRLLRGFARPRAEKLARGPPG